MPSPHIPDWARALKNHERRNAGLDGDLPAHLITPETLLPAALAAKAAELDARERALDARESLAAFQSLIRTLQLASNPCVIGGRNGITPSPSFDCVLTTAGPHGSVRDLPRQILWVPVPLYALPKPGPAHPVYGPSHILGETRVQDSLAFPLMVSAARRNDCPAQPVLRPVAINAYCKVTLSPVSPEETLTRLDRRDRRHTLEINSPTADTDLERDNLDAECDSPAFSSSPLTAAALRSFNVTSPHPSPSTVAAHNPTSSPAAPFDAGGNARLP